MVLEFGGVCKGINIMVVGIIIWHMGTGSIIGQMVINMRVNGNTILGMGKDLTYLVMVIYIKAPILMVLRKVKVTINGRMVTNTQVSS